MLTDWDTVSVCVVPYPSSHASQEPAWAGSLDELFTTPDVAVHGAAVPVSKPGLPSSCAAVQPVPPVGGGLGLPPVEPEPASHAVALSASAASVPAGSSQPSNSVLPDWPVPSS